MKVCGVVKKQEDLEEYINYLAEDLKRRAKHISVDWNKKIKNIKITTKLTPNELLNWEVTKTYLADKETKDEENI